MSNSNTKRMMAKDAKCGIGDGINIHADNEISAPISIEKQNYDSKGDAQMKPLVICGRGGCINAAIVHPDWDGDFCSRDCALMRCHEVFLRWVNSQKNGSKYKNKQ